MTDNTPTLHHLNNSQSQRILWLLEELGMEYKVVLHERNKPGGGPALVPFKSPPSLLAVSPTGKAPLLITGAADHHRTIVESSAIATYLIRTFDTHDRFGLRDGDWVRDEVLTSMVGTTLARASFNLLMLDFQLIRNGPGPMGKSFDGPMLRASLGDLERELIEGPEGGWLMGKEPGRADILMEFPLSSCRSRQTVDLKKEFPKLDEWLDKVYARAAWKRGLEKGNGYDGNVFPKLPHL